MRAMEEVGAPTALRCPKAEMGGCSESRQAFLFASWSSHSLHSSSSFHSISVPSRYHAVSVLSY